MITFTICVLSAGLMLLVVAGMPPCIAGANGRESSFSSAELERMSVFLSNFTEVGLTNFRAADVLDPQNPEEAIHFGVWHNYVNNYKSRIAQCTAGCAMTCVMLDGKYVRQSLEKYFGPSVPLQSVKGYRYEGKLFHFQAADGAGNCFVKVLWAQNNADGTVRMRGLLYNPDNDAPTRGSLEAVARPHSYEGKTLWRIVRMASSE